MASIAQTDKHDTIDHYAAARLVACRERQAELRSRHRAANALDAGLPLDAWRQLLREQRHVAGARAGAAVLRAAGRRRRALRLGHGCVRELHQQPSLGNGTRVRWRMQHAVQGAPHAGTRHLKATNTARTQQCFHSTTVRQTGTGAHNCVVHVAELVHQLRQDELEAVPADLHTSNQHASAGGADRGKTYVITGSCQNITLMLCRHCCGCKVQHGDRYCACTSAMWPAVVSGNMSSGVAATAVARSCSWLAQEPLLGSRCPPAWPSPSSGGLSPCSAW